MVTSGSLRVISANVYLASPYHHRANRITLLLSVSDFFCINSSGLNKTAAAEIVPLMSTYPIVCYRTLFDEHVRVLSDLPIGQCPTFCLLLSIASNPGIVLIR